MKTGEHIPEIHREKFIKFRTNGSYVDMSKEFADLVAEGHRNIVLDMYNINKIDSKHMGTIVMFHKEMKERGGKFSLVNLSNELYEIFRYLYLDRRIPMERLDESNP